MKKKNIKNLKQSFKDAPISLRNELVGQFEPLINKIVGQQFKILKADWDVLKSMAYEGFAIALNDYDPEKSTMSFTQYSAFAILNNIRNKSVQELHAVKITSYTADKIKKGELTGSTFESTGIDSVSDLYSKIKNEQPKFGEDPLELLQIEILENCNPIDAQCFFKYYGIGGYDETKVSDMAKEFGVSNGRISQRIKNILNFVKSNELLLESLRSLLE